MVHDVQFYGITCKLTATASVTLPDQQEIDVPLRIRVERGITSLEMDTDDVWSAVIAYKKALDNRSSGI